MSGRLLIYLADSLIDGKLPFMTQRKRMANKYSTLVPFLVLVLMVVFSVTRASASGLSDVLVLDDEFGRISLNRHAEFIEDVTAQLTIGEVSSLEYADGFKRVEEGVPNFGFTSSAYWVRLRLKSLQDEKNQMVLQLPYAAIDLIDVYIPQEDNSYTIKTAGDSVAFSLREIKYPTPAFYIDVPHTDSPQSHTEIFLRVKTTSSMQLPLVLWTTEAFTNSSSKEQLFWGLLFGTLLIAACYNLFLFFSVRDRVFLYYVLFVTSLIMMQLTLYGYSIQYFWPDNPELSNSALLVFLNLTVIYATLFSRHFLKLKQHAARLDKALFVLSVYMIIDLVMGFIAPYSLALKMYIVGLTIGAPLFVLSGVVCWRAGFPPAKIYLLAWLVLVLGGVAYALKTWGYLPATVFSTYALPLGSLFEVVLFSIALGVRVKLQQKETYAARKAVMDMQTKLFEANQVALRNAQESDLLKQEFLATMSHELRTPMNGILGCCQLLDDREMSDEDRVTMDSLSDSARQMMGHVNRILNFSQLNEGKLSLDCTVFNLRDLIAQLELNFSVFCSEKQVGFSIDIDSSVPDFLVGDQQKLLHVLNDLLDNSVRFTNKGNVQVLLSIDDGFSNADEGVKGLCVEIKDTGVGVSEEDKRSIFAMFSQQDGSFKRANGGLGLGLAICKKYVELMKGDIDFQSSPEVGTSVTLTLPMRVADSQERLSKVTAKRLDKNECEDDLVILLVEDNRTNQLIMKGILKKLGFKTKVAANGIEALALLEKESFDLILMDCQMPIMDGFEVTKEIRKRDWFFKDIPIIAVTANAMAGDRERCLNVGMDDYLSKPITKQAIEEKVNFWLAKSKGFVA